MKKKKFLHSRQNVKIEAPVLKPTKIICVGHNYREHILEMQRELQRRTIQWLQGKTLDGSAPMGPWLVTKDEIANPHELEVVLSVNGEERQRSNTGNLVFNVNDLVEFLSGIMTLEPGDVICTGTPGGVGVAWNPQAFLHDGDVVRIKIDKIGVLENKVKAVQSKVEAAK